MLGEIASSDNKPIQLLLTGTENDWVSDRTARVSESRTAYDSKRNTFTLFAGISILIIAIIMIVHQASVEIDETEARMERRAISAVLDGRTREQARLAVDYGWWERVYEQVLTTIDPKWAQDNLGPWLHYSYGIDTVAILNSAGDTVYFWQYADARETQEEFSFPPNIDVLVAQARTLVDSTPQSSVAFLASPDRLDLISVSPIMPEDPARAATGQQPPPVLILADTIDPAWLRQITALTGIEGLSLEISRVPGRNSLALRDPLGNETAYLTWQEPEHSGTLIPGVAPWLVIAFGTAMVFAGLVGAQLLQTARALTQRNAELLESEANARDAQRRAEDASQAKSRFLASVSHEVRTPLNAIIGFSDLLRETSSQPISDEMSREYAGYIHESGERLLALLNDILDLAKVEAGRLDVHEDIIELNPIFRQCLRTIQPVAKNRSIDLSSEIETSLPRVKVDSRRLEQIILNLMGNAVKYTDPGGHITVTAGLIPSGIEIAVTDTGIGIDEADLARVFEPFTQVGDPMRRRQDGVGLGLPLARQLCQALGASLDLTSALGVGTTARVLLPHDRLVA